MKKILILVVFASVLSFRVKVSMGQEATASPTATPTPSLTPTRTRTPTRTPTSVWTATPAPTSANGTPTPTAGDHDVATHVTALELTLLKGMAEAPLYADWCIANSYVPKPDNPEGCRCVLYFKRVSGTNYLAYRCPDGIEHTVTVSP